MDREKVDSSNLESVGYSEGVLEVEFKNGAIYRYFDVSSETFKELMNSDSLGKYFNSNIRNNYEFELVD